MSKLSWGVIVITYNRIDFLLEMLHFTLSQNRMPTEVVVVDASDNWQENHKRVLDTYAEHWASVRLAYEPAKVRSIPYQRNQALELAEADIVFSLDDDIYLEPDAAEIIMNAYEKDEKEEVAMIGGHFTPAAPGQVVAATEEAPAEPESVGFLGKIKRTLEQGLTLERHFVPYGESVKLREPPEALKGMGIFPSGLLNGGRSTFRRRFGVQCRWSTLLRYYAAHEDSDFSYRMSRFGKILVAPDAGFFHADGAEARPNKFKINTIRVRNLMALHRVSSENRLKSSIRLLLSFMYFIGLYLLIDPARKRFTLPNVLSYALAVLYIPYFMFYPFRDFTVWYKNKQEQMYLAR